MTSDVIAWKAADSLVVDAVRLLRKVGGRREVAKLSAVVQAHRPSGVLLKWPKRIVYHLLRSNTTRPIAMRCLQAKVRRQHD